MMKLSTPQNSLTEVHFLLVELSDNGTLCINSIRLAQMLLINFC